MALKTALITGALGQDGRLLAQLLIDMGYRVVGLIAPGKTPARDGPLTAMHFVSADLSDSTAVRTLLTKWQPDELYHLAAFHHASQENSISSMLAGKEAMLSSNFLSTKTLAFALLELRASCHLVFAASSQMYTAQSQSQEITENSPRRPSTFYGLTKSWSVDLLAFLREESGLQASSAILFNHESPLRGTQFVSRKITQAAAAAKAGHSTRLELSNIGSRVDWCSARDVVRALHLMASAKDARDYVVASGQLHSVRDLLEIAFQHVGLDWKDYTTLQSDREGPALLGNSRMLHEALGWQRTLTFEDMISEMVDHDLTNAHVPFLP